MQIITLGDTYGAYTDVLAAGIIAGHLIEEPGGYRFRGCNRSMKEACKKLPPLMTRHDTALELIAAAVIGWNRSAFKVIRCMQAFGVGTNDRGGRYIGLRWGSLADQDDRIYERYVSHAGGIPGDGGENPRFSRLREALGCEPFDATDDQIRAAWIIA